MPTSRLPRLRSPSPTQPSENVPSAAEAPYVNTRKRKSTRDGDDDEEEEEEEQDTLEEMVRPRKIAALGTAARPMRTRTVSGPSKPNLNNNNKPLNTSRNAGNLQFSSSFGLNPNGNANSTSTNESTSKVPTLSSSRLGPPKTVAKPRPVAGRLGRGTSAPPTAGPSRLTSRPPPSTTARTRTVSTSTRPGLRSATAGPTNKKRTPPKAPNRTVPTHPHPAALEAARAADERLSAEMALERSKLSELQNNHAALSKQLTEAREAEMKHKREMVSFTDELDEMRTKHAREVGELEMECRRREREGREVGEDLRVARGEVERERGVTEHLKVTLAQQSQAHRTMETENGDLRREVRELKGKLEEMREEVESMRGEARERDGVVGALRREVFESETLRRKLHNTILELKGNIRVFCRVRPVLPSDLPPGAARIESLDDEEGGKKEEVVKAKMAFPGEEGKDIVLYSTSESAMGNERKDVWRFGFDRVFTPQSTQSDVFADISALAQSCVDGYNVCVFAYGQTGSGKSWTMEGGETESTAGMIPRAVEQVFRVAEEMRSKGWVYSIEGQFLEIYNETIHDLLTPFDTTHKKKHEIKHDPKTGRTTVTDATVVKLGSAGQVKTLLASAQSRRSVAATLMNERSSRSHSVFTLRISGVNVGSRAMKASFGSYDLNDPNGLNGGLDPNGPTNGFGRSDGADGGADGGDGGGDAAEVPGTGERCEGCLNLVDLAGSERLNVSFGPGVTEKERVRETQSINKSLSALGDVIAALGERGAQSNGGGGGGVGSGGNGARETHVPYRNSKLTYLLQNSLSGNSKTLMVLNLSPLAAHLNESLTSLRFATKVNNTKIGAGKKTAVVPPP